MAQKPITIDGVLGGWSESYYLGSKGTFNVSLGIDPDYAIGQTKSSGAIVPVGYEKFADLTGYPKWIITNPKTADTYVYTSADFLKYDSDYSESSLTLPTNGAGNGGVYYNDYIYLATPTDIARYGQLSGTPSLTNNAWTGATLGSLTALANTTYPSISGTSIPNHPMFSHSDNSVYVGDVVSGKGCLHRIITNATGTNDGSAYNVIDFPYGYYPTCIGNFGKDIAVGCIQGSANATTIQGEAKMFLWEVTNTDTFYDEVPLGDPLVTAIKNINGNLYVWSGNLTSHRVRIYLGNQMFKDVCSVDDCPPPFQGAVDSEKGKTYWGGSTTYPENTASVFSFGSTSNLGMGLHNVARSTATGANAMITALKAIQSNKLVLGVGSDSEKQLEKYSATASINSTFRTMVFPINHRFQIERIKLSLGGAVTASTVITPKVYVDDGSDSEALKVINSTNFSNSERIIKLSSTKIGNNNFFLEFAFSGTTSLPILLPITVYFKLLDNE